MWLMIYCRAYIHSTLSSASYYDLDLILERVQGCDSLTGHKATLRIKC